MMATPLLHQAAGGNPPTKPDDCKETLAQSYTYDDGTYNKYVHYEFINAVNQFKACPTDPCKPGDPDPVGKQTASNDRTVIVTQSSGIKTGLAALFRILTGTSVDYANSSNTTTVTRTAITTPDGLKIGAGTRALYYWSDYYEREAEQHASDKEGSGNRGRTTYLISGVRGGTMPINSIYIVCTDDLTEKGCPSKCPPAAPAPGGGPTATPCEAEPPCTAAD